MQNKNTTITSNRFLEKTVWYAFKRGNPEQATVLEIFKEKYNCKPIMQGSLVSIRRQINPSRDLIFIDESCDRSRVKVQVQKLAKLGPLPLIVTRMKSIPNQDCHVLYAISIDPAIIPINRPISSLLSVAYIESLRAQLRKQYPIHLTRQECWVALHFQTEYLYNEKVIQKLNLSIRARYFHRRNILQKFKTDSMENVVSMMGGILCVSKF